MFFKLYEKTKCVFAAFFTGGLQGNRAELLHTATIVKNGAFACVESVRMVVFHAPRARETRLMLRLIQTSKRKHLYWQDFCIRGDLLPADVMVNQQINV